MQRAVFVLLSVLMLVVGFASCSSSSGGGDAVTGADTTVDHGSNPLALTVCDPSKGPFSNDKIDNEFFPLPVGMKHVLEGQDADKGGLVRVEITVLDKTETIAGVVTRVVEEREFANDILFEVSRNFFVQAPDGTVCYFGEDVDEYDTDQVTITGHSGQWRADGTTNKPGIQMPAHPAVGMTYAHEDAPKVAQDNADVTALGTSTTTPAGTFTDTLVTSEWSPLEPDVSPKVFARGVGLIVDATYLLKTK